ncbi:uncharacterized protein LOC142335034 [Convolutriloba macropyga]|uniref:uncharacterized protein LOC142335034 n=1 Tax=Convolutriloba macropyga TaxID=536237 RepID=UPI003F52261F
MRDCANAVHSAENVAWAAVMESPYAEDGNLLDISGTGLEFMCWSIDEVPDYDSPMVEEDSAFMSCYLKGRNVCPIVTSGSRQVASETRPGAWVTGLTVNYPIPTEAETVTYGATADCDMISLWEGESDTVGYVAASKPGNSTHFDCFAHTRGRGGLVPVKSAPDPMGSLRYRIWSPSKLIDEHSKTCMVTALVEFPTLHHKTLADHKCLITVLDLFVPPVPCIPPPNQCYLDFNRSRASVLYYGIFWVMSRYEIRAILSMVGNHTF